MYSTNSELDTMIGEGGRGAGLVIASKTVSTRPLDIGEHRPGDIRGNKPGFVALILLSMFPVKLL